MKHFQGWVIILLSVFIWSSSVWAQLKPGLLFSIPQDSNQDIKCGFRNILEANRPANIELYRHLKQLKITASQDDSIYFSPSGHFKILYQTDGYHAIPVYDRDQNGIPDYLEFVAKSFDQAWSIEIDSLGFKPPPDSSGNFREVYPVHCRRLPIYGQTWLDYEIPSMPNLNYVTFIEISTNFNFVNYPNITDPVIRDSMAIAVTAAHEFNHALQTGYRLWPDDGSFHDFWFIESSATFMEEIVAPEVNDYLQYLDDYFRYAHEPFDQSRGDLSDYGKVVIEILLGENFPTDFVRKTWEEIENQRALPALAEVLSRMNGNLSVEFRRLSAWLYFTSERAIAGKYFPDAALFPDPRFLTANPVGDTRSILKSDSLPRLAFQWYTSTILQYIPLQIHLEAAQGSDATLSAATLIDFRDATYLQFPASTSRQIDLSTLQTVFPTGVVNSNLSGDDYFTFNVLSNPFTGWVSQDVSVFPQPLKLSKSQQFLQFENLPVNSSISIYNSQGVHVITLYPPSDQQRSIWNLRNEHGHQVGSGVYLFYIKSAGNEQRGKFVIIH